MLRIIWSLVIAFLLATLLVTLLGESPLLFLKVLTTNVFRSQYDFGMFLSFATPLIFTGLAVSLPLRAGLFNIGAEGQLHVGALGCFLAGVLWQNAPFPFSIIWSMCGGMVFAGVWGLFPGALRYYTGMHEVISSILLNFIAVAFTNWICLDFFQNPESQNPETYSLPSQFLLTPWSFFQGAPVSSALIVAILSAFVLWFFSKENTMGIATRNGGPTNFICTNLSLTR